jgi:hypothetical protein
MKNYSTISVAVSLLIVLAVANSVRREMRVTTAPQPEPGSAAFAMSNDMRSSRNLRPVPQIHRNPENSTASERNLQETPEASVLREFNVWADKYVGARSAEAKQALESEGELLALERRPVLARLIQSDPEQAIRSATPMSVRSQLPASISQHLEERVSGRAQYEVIAVGIPGELEPEPTIKRYATINDRTFRAFVYGRRLAQTTKENIPLHGVAIDDALAVHQSPVRVLEPGESPDPSLPVGLSGLCPVSQQAAASKIAVETGGEVFHLCQEGHIAAFNAKLEQQEAGLAPETTNDTEGSAGIRRTHGAKKVLFMRVIFPDASGESISEGDANDLMRQADNFFIENSYGAISLQTTVTPLLTLEQPATWYAANMASYELLRDARRAAAAAGYNTDDYDLDIVHSAVPRLGAQAYVGNKGAWLNTSNAGTACHELGHNLGLWHANAWITSDGIIGAGANREYGNVFDTMGNAQALLGFNAYFRHQLDWLPETAIQTITSNGVYRLYPFDVSTRDNKATYALKIETGSGRDYWIEARQQLLTSSWSPANVLVYWSPWAQSAGGDQLLDMNPGGSGGFYDAGLALGKSFDDPTLGLTITPLRLGGTTPESIDVMVTARAVWTSNVLDPDRHLATSRVTLEAQGDEAALAFDLVFPKTWLRNPRATLGADAAGAALELDTDSAASGRLGIRLSLPNGGSFAPGVRDLLVVDFDTVPEIKNPSFIRVAIDDNPGSRVISAVNGTYLHAIYRSSALALIASQPQLSVTRELNGDCTITLSNVVESSYDLEATSDFVTWDFVGTIPVTTGTAQITDSSAREQQYRFYRAVQK